MTITFKLKGKNNGLPKTVERFYVLLFNACAFCAEKINYSYLFKFLLRPEALFVAVHFLVLETAKSLACKKTVLTLYDYVRTE